MSYQMLSYCGIDCSVCPAYSATRANDIEKLTSLAVEWFEGSMDYSIVECEGCKGEGRIMKWCNECPTRACAIDRQMENCAYCRDYGCEKLLKVFEMSEEPRQNLERIRASL
jgi:predicted nucleic acid binding AN1-type Zn finger protein